jgi:hypothetical protein
VSKIFPKFDAFRANLLLGFLSGGLILFLIGQANYWVYFDRNAIPFGWHDWLNRLQVTYVIAAVAAAFVFIEDAMVHERRYSLTGLASGFLATVPFVFGVLWYTLHMALHAQHHFLFH